MYPRVSLPAIQLTLPTECDSISNIFCSQLYAVGEGNTPGMNERLLHYFEQRKGQRFGVISESLIAKLTHMKNPT
jgi:hypothetical protein